MPIKYIGRRHDFKGKTLWEIVGNLKNFGIGRIVTRSIFERYPEPSYLKIVKVETYPNPEYNTPDDMRKVKVTAEKVFRGRKYSELECIFHTSYKTDYVLIPKDKEAEYCKFDKSPQDKILPRTTNFPPLLEQLIVREMKAKGEKVTEPPKLKIVCSQSKENHYRVAEEGEEPTAEFTSGFGKPLPTSMHLYKGLKF